MNGLALGLNFFIFRFFYFCFEFYYSKIPVLNQVKVVGVLVKIWDSISIKISIVALNKCHKF